MIAQIGDEVVGGDGDASWIDRRYLEVSRKYPGGRRYHVSVWVAYDTVIHRIGGQYGPMWTVMSVTNTPPPLERAHN